MSKYEVVRDWDFPTSKSGVRVFRVGQVFDNLTRDQIKAGKAKGAIKLIGNKSDDKDN